MFFFDLGDWIINSTYLLQREKVKRLRLEPGKHTPYFLNIVQDV